jgi:hypothetical protein
MMGSQYSSEIIPVKNLVVIRRTMTSVKRHLDNIDGSTCSVIMERCCHLLVEGLMTVVVVFEIV